MLKKTKSFFYIILAAFVICLAILGITVYQAIAALPDEIYLIGDSARVLDVELPFALTIRANTQDQEAISAVKLDGTSLADEPVYNFSNSVEITTEKDVSTDVSVELFGLIPIKNIKITSIEEVLLLPGGQSIGVTLHTKGALVVGNMDYMSQETGQQINPAADAGLQAGDVIEKYNDITIDNAAHLTKLVNESENEQDKLLVKRGAKQIELTIKPVKDAADGNLKLGVWVRDSTVGVGTLTFVDVTSGGFAGLGHAITDVDTGELLTVKDGTIVKSEIVEVVKGEAGEPGELKGQFSGANQKIGTIEKNTEYGIYGNANSSVKNGLYDVLLAADRSEVKEGAASILCTLDGQGVQEYSCKIVKVNKQNQPSQKSLIIEVDDEELLKKTGGIVQGMSGSPILQNGKIVGAVTHVFVDDPTRGYGLYVDWMLAEMYQLTS